MSAAIVGRESRDRSDPRPTARTDAAPAATAARIASSGRALVTDRGEELREEDVARADTRDRLDVRCERAQPPGLPADTEQREAAVLERDEDVARAHLGDRVERHQEVVVVLELLADELLGLALVRRDEERPGLDAESQRLALGVEHDADVAPREVADRVGVERRLHLARQRAGEDDEVGAAREVVELLDEHLELGRRHLGPPLVDLRVRAGRRDRRPRSTFATRRRSGRSR